MYKDRITTALLNASLLINKVLKGDCTFQEFVNEYGNFFYYEALDGHEANQQEQEVLSQLNDAVDLHRRVQCEVIDLVCFDHSGDSARTKEYLEAGRITPVQARERLEQLSQQCDLESMVEKLGG